MLFIFGESNNNQSFVNQFDTNKQHAINTPSSRRSYRAITLPDDNILYIGGLNDGINPTDTLASLLLMPMDNLPLYNTKTNTWTIMNITGPTPPSRVYFSAVLTPDGRIIIFGGYQLLSGTYGDLWILDIITYQWSVGKILNPIANLNLVGHTATLVDNYMFVKKVRLRTVPDRVLKNYVTIEVVKLQRKIWLPYCYCPIVCKPNVEMNIMDQTQVKTLAFTLRPSIVMKNRLWSSFKNPIAIWKGFFSNTTYSSKIFMLNVSQKDSYRWVTEFIPNITTTTTVTNSIIS
ncbi:22618_t:CDS:2, partial [Cetraspora pellucida]